MRQCEEGFWVGELEGDTILESEYILLMTFLGRETDSVCVKCARYIQDHQLDDGGWAIYPGGPTDISASVKAYFALKLVGISPERPRDGPRQAWRFSTRAVPHQCNSFTRFYLALLGQISYDECPCVPPELVLIPSRLSFSLSAMSAWTRTIVVPLSIMAYYKPVRSLETERGIAELFRSDCGRPSRRTARWLSWTNFFLIVDQVLKGLDRLVPAPLPSARHRGRAPLDARALRKHRRSGCDLPPDGLLDHRAAMPGLRVGFAGRHVGDEAARRLAHRRRRHAFACSRAFRRCGTRPSP